MDNQQSQKNAVNNNQSSQQGQKDQKSQQQGGFQKDAQKSDTSRPGQTTGSPTRNQ